MKRITQAEAIQRLIDRDARIGSRVRVRYVEGLPVTPRAISEARTQRERGMDLRVFVGTLEAIGINQRGEFYFTLFTPDRDTIEPDGTCRRGNWRSFNPSIGELWGLSVLDRL